MSPSKQVYRLGMDGTLTVTDHVADDPTSKVSPGYRFVTRLELAGPLLSNGSTRDESLGTLVVKLRHLADEIDKIRRGA